MKTTEAELIELIKEEIQNIAEDYGRGNLKKSLARKAHRVAPEFTRESQTVAEKLRKLTSEQVKQMIIEEMESDPALKAAIDKLSSKIEDLDVSIDYLTSAITGEDTLAIALGQKSTGR